MYIFSSLIRDLLKPVDFFFDRLIIIKIMYFYFFIKAIAVCLSIIKKNAHTTGAVAEKRTIDPWSLHYFKSPPLFKNEESEA